MATARAELTALESASAEPAPEGPAAVLNIPESSQLGTVATPDPGLLGESMMLPLGAGALFAAMLILGFLMVNPVMDVRLDPAAGADRVAGISDRLTSAADRLVARRDEEGELDKVLDAAGINLRPGEFTLTGIVVVVVASMFGWLLGGLALGIVVAILTVAAGFIFLSQQAARKRQKFGEQMPDTLGILSGSIRAGRGLPQAIELVAQESSEPTANQFRRIVFETQVGRDLTESMMGVADRMKNEEFLWIARAFDINRELGGDLTEILDNIAETIRERRRVARMVQALSAEGRASGWVMLSLPFVMFLFTVWRTPDHAALLTETNFGRILIVVGLVNMVIGYFWIRKLVDLKY